MVFFFSKTAETKTKEIPKDDYDEIMKLFKLCDVNTDGKLSREEVKAGFLKLQSRFPQYRSHRSFQMAYDGYMNVDDELDKLVIYFQSCYSGKRNIELLRIKPN